MRVNGPGGIVINFPDGTDPGTVDRVMREAVNKAAPQQPAAPPKQEPYRGAILPLSRDAEGNVSLAVPGLIKGAWDTLSKAGEGMRTGTVTPETVDATIGLGALATPMSPAAGTGKAIAGVAAMRRGERQVPSREQLREAGGAAMTRAKSMGVEYDPAVISQFAAFARSKLQGRFNAISAKNTFKVLRDMEKPGPTIYNTVDGLHTAQQSLRNGVSDSDNAAGEFIVQALQRFMEDPPAQAVLAGPAREAGQLLGEGKANWAAMARSKEVSGKQRQAQLRAWAANSGLNMDNTLRQRVTDLLTNKSALKGFTKDEVAKLEAFVKGGSAISPRNLTRRVANALSGGIGLTAGLAGALSGHPAALAIPLAGMGTKVVQNALGKRAMNSMDEEFRMRSPLYGTQAMGPPAPIPPGMMNQAMQRAMMMGLYPPPQGGGW